MRAIDFLLIGIVSLAILLLASNHYYTYGDFSLSLINSESNIDYIRSTIKNQKEILALERANQRLKSNNVSISKKTLVDDNRIISSLTDLIKSKDSQIEELLDQIEELRSLQLQQQTFLLNISSSQELGAKGEEVSSNNIKNENNNNLQLPKKDSYSLDVEDGELQKHCEAKFGTSLIDNWRASQQVWCSSSSVGNGISETDKNTDHINEMGSHSNSSPKSQTQSELRCYPYHQLHKQRDGRGPDMFCEATNFVIDFSKVHGLASGSKPHLGAQYHSFDIGSLQGNCRKTDHYRSELFMPHHAQQMSSFQADSSLPVDAQVVDHPVYLLARDEDCENTFHHTADLVS